MRAKMKYILLLILAVGITIWGYMKFEQLGQVGGSMVVAGALAIAIYSGIEILF